MAAKMWGAKERKNEKNKKKGIQGGINLVI